MLHQFKLYQTSCELKPDHCIDIPYPEMEKAARYDGLGFDLARPLSRDDVIDFSQKIAKNWGVFITYDHIHQKFTMYK